MSRTKITNRLIYVLSLPGFLLLAPWANAEVSLARTSSAETNNESTFKVYGFLRPVVSVSSRSVSSFGNAATENGSLVWKRENAVAATEAAPASQMAYGKTMRSHWGVGQSRFGFDFHHGPLDGQGKSVDAKIEMDFVDFDRSEATTAIRPRLRIAGANLNLDDGWSVFAGQDWDILSAAKPFVYNFVSLYFRAGNIGFMRPQVRLAKTDSEKREVMAFMVGVAGLNDSDSNSSAVERGAAPSFGARLTPFRSAKVIAGFTSLAAPRRYESGWDHKLKWSYVGKVFAEIKPSSSFEIHSSFFGGTNINSTGSALSLGSGSFTGNQFEVGGYITSIVHLCPSTELTIGTGFDKLLGDSENRAGAIEGNYVSRVAAKHQIMTHVQFFSEFSSFFTKYRWSSNTTFHENAFQLESGIIVTL